MIDNELFDATARTGLIDKGETIRVVGYSSAQLVVKKG
jgi:membrane-bound ClpP family serine protease